MAPTLALTAEEDFDSSHSWAVVITHPMVGLAIQTVVYWWEISEWQIANQSLSERCGRPK